MNRREVLKIAAAMGCMGTAGRLMAAENKEKIENFIFINLNGGPSQFELFDAKPGTFNSGPTKHIKTQIKDLYFNSTLSRMVQISSNMVVLRMASPETDHKRGQYYMQSGGSRPLSELTHPGLCSIIGHYKQKKEDLPPALVIGSALGSGYLGMNNSPFIIENLSKTNVLLRGMNPRFSNLDELSNLQRQFNSLSPKKEFSAVKEQEAVVEKSLKISSNKVFISTLTNRLRRIGSSQNSRYLAGFGPVQPGGGSPQPAVQLSPSESFKNQCLLAVDLVKIGIPAIQLELSGWDSHTDNFSTQNELSEILDAGVDTLVKQLKAIGLFGKTLIYIAGEFGRTPKINRNEGRDDYSKIYCAAMISGQISSGKVFGETSKDGDEIKDAVSVAQASSAILTSMGIDYKEKVNGVTPLISLNRPELIFK